MSKDYAMYLHGCDGFHSVLNVDEHTVIDIANSSGLDKSKAHEDLYKRYVGLGKDPDDPINKLVAKHKEEILQEEAIQLSCKKLSSEAFGDDTYVSCRCDQERWWIGRRGHIRYEPRRQART